MAGIKRNVIRTSMNQNQRKTIQLWLFYIETKQNLMSKIHGSKKKGIGSKVLFLCVYILITVVFDIYLSLVKYYEKIIMAITFPND